MATATVASRTAAVSQPAAHRRPLRLGRIAAWAAMIIIILITSFSTSRSLFSDPGSLLPVDFTTGAYKRVFGLASVAEAQAEGGSGASVSFLLFMRNSIIFSVVATAGQVFFSALAAYAFA